jgi:nucleoside-diphosphate-sugar epimerase
MDKKRWLCHINAMIRTACLGRPIPVYGDGKQLRDYVHVVDVVEALLLAGTSSAVHNAILNFGNGESIPFSLAAEIIAAAADVDVVRRPWPKEDLLNETGDYIVNVEKARKLLGFVAKQRFRDSIKALVDQVRYQMSHQSKSSQPASAKSD